MPRRNSWYRVLEKHFASKLLSIFIVSTLLLTSVFYFVVVPSLPHSIDKDNLKLSVELSGVIVGGAALLIALIEGRRGEEVQQSLTTQYVGEFPHFISRISDILGKANNSVTIVADYPAYGAISAPPDSQTYVNRLEETCTRLGKNRAHGDSSCMIITMNRTGREASRATQFSVSAMHQKTEWVERRTADYAKGDKSVFLRFLKFHPNEPESRDPHSLTFNDLNTLRKRIDDHVVERLSAVCYETNYLLTIHMWIVDEQYAVFSVPTFEKGTAAEYGFYTADSRLVGALSAIAERFKHSAARYQPGHDQVAHVADGTGNSSMAGST